MIIYFTIQKFMAEGQMEALDLAIDNFKNAIQNLADQYSKVWVLKNANFIK